MVEFQINKISTELILQLFGVERSHQAVFQWVQRVSDSVGDPYEARPKRVTVDETTIKINSEWCWLYTVIALGTKLILNVQLFGRHGTDPAVAFLHGPRKKHDSRTLCPSLTNSTIGLSFLD